MFEEIQRLTGITALIRLLHLPPYAQALRDIQVSVLEKAYLMQVRLDLESKVEAALGRSSQCRYPRSQHDQDIVIFASVRHSQANRLSGHASQQLRFRGTTESEVVTAIRTAPWHPAESGRMECRKDFPFDALWNGRHYSTKQVRPVFVEEPNEIVVVTVYVYYF